MKHIIVIESADKPLLDRDLVRFRTDCIEAVHKIATKYVGFSFIQTSFNKNSAIKAICELYNVDSSILDLN